MSIMIMSKCWLLQGMTATQKIVLVSLADQANDDGYWKHPRGRGENTIAPVRDNSQKETPPRARGKRVSGP